MKPDWDKLMAEFAGSPSSLVGDVDCTAAGDKLCTDNGVQGFPTIKYGDVGDLKDYNGGRDYESLKAFAEENLGATCGPASLDLCDAATKAKYDEYLAMDVGKLEKRVLKISTAYEDDCDLDEDECAPSLVKEFKEEVPFMKKAVAHMQKGGRSEL